ncbi:hypothetical protein OESDEN_01922 [Oesophagostomum dentatum]|uniref:Uncharacterized protein n=1 Tax=Oesophagostomum dentatum TaxID=61180 RepID=A0A0B1TKN0_OESDE|nr:hypothetical protein OESDEN_01922 [Oesophagostomum dentatum]
MRNQLQWRIGTSFEHNSSPRSKDWEEQQEAQVATAKAEEEELTEQDHEAVVCAIRESYKGKWLKELEQDEQWIPVIEFVKKKEGAVIKNATTPGHLRFQCLDGCLVGAKLSAIKDVTFPGAFAKEPIGIVWKAWVAASIFSRSDLDLSKKIRFYRQGAICLDENALKPILRLAYEKCTAWTEFICTTERIQEHEKVERFAIERMYDEARQALKNELEEETRATRPQKEGPTGFAAPERAAAMENDGVREGLHTVVARIFKELREKLNE